MIALEATSQSFSDGPNIMYQITYFASQKAARFLMTQEH